MLEKYKKGYKDRDWIGEIAEEKGKTRAEAEAYLRRSIPAERYFQTKIMNRLKKEFPEAFIVKVAQGQYSRAGIPDILCIAEGRYYGFEVKRPIFGKPSKLQEMTVLAINKAGGTAAFVTYPEEAVSIIRWKQGEGEPLLD